MRKWFSTTSDNRLNYDYGYNVENPNYVSTATISNPRSAHTLTIVGGANQPINGLTSAITIGSNSTVKLTDVPNAKTVSGCHWAM